jgi:hypothetical protein
MDPIREQIDTLTRRHFFGRTGLSLGAAALSSLLADLTYCPRPPRRPAACPACPIFRPRQSARSICT